MDGDDAVKAAYLDLISSLGHLAPNPLFQMLWLLRQREFDSVRPGYRAGLQNQIRAGIEAFPALAAAIDADAVVAANSEFVIARRVDWVYLTACRSVPGLDDEVVSYQGLDLLREAAKQGPVILSAFHFGPSEMLAVGIARRCLPVTVVACDMAEHQDGGDRKMMLRFSDADVELLASDSVSVLLKCLQALRRGRAVMLFPELSKAKETEQHAGIPFGGRTVYAAVGTAALAAKTGAMVLPCHVERRGPGTYHCVISHPLQRGVDITTQLFARCEALIREGLAAEWEMWRFVPDLLQEPPGAE